MTVPSYTEEDERLVLDAILDADHLDSPVTVARAILAALSSAGRLVPPGSEVRERWGVRWRDPDGAVVGSLYGLLGDPDDAWTTPLHDAATKEFLRALEIITPYVPWSPSVPDTKEGS